MKFLDKYGLKPQKLSYELDGVRHEFYAKSISYNLAVAISQQYLESVRMVAIIKFCLCEEDGTMVFPDDCQLEQIGDALSYEVISLISTEIAKASGPQKRVDDIKKKQDS